MRIFWALKSLDYDLGLDLSECMCKLCMTTGVKYVWHWPECPLPKNPYSPKGPDLYRLSLSSKSLTSIESLYPKGRYLYRVSLTKGTPTCNEYVPDPCPECLLQKVPNLYWLYLPRRPWLGLKCPVSNSSLTCTECPFPKGPWLPGPQRPSVTPPSPSIGVSELSARKLKNTELTSPLFLRC